MSRVAPSRGRGPRASPARRSRGPRPGRRPGAGSGTARPARGPQGEGRRGRLPRPPEGPRQSGPGPSRPQAPASPARPGRDRRTGGAPLIRLPRIRGKASRPGRGGRRRRPEPPPSSWMSTAPAIEAPAEATKAKSGSRAHRSSAPILPS